MFNIDHVCHIYQTNYNTNIKGGRQLVNKLKV